MASTVFLLCKKTLLDIPKGASPVKPRHCCWGFIKRKIQPMAQTDGGSPLRGVGRIFHKKNPSAASGWLDFLIVQNFMHQNIFILGHLRVSYEKVSCNAVFARSGYRMY